MLLQQTSSGHMFGRYQQDETEEEVEEQDCWEWDCSRLYILGEAVGRWYTGPIKCAIWRVY